MVWALRTFFRYLRHRGYIDVNLAGCVPSVPEYSLSTLPKCLPCGSIERVLQSCDRTIAQGRRDYAVMLLLARLGLRGGEVVVLMLDDVDWDLGQINVRGKGGRFAKLPLPADAGEALADYLKSDRPLSSSRRLFLTLRAPATGMCGASIISSLVKRALARAGVESERKGAHLFRHTLATEMLQRGAKLREIGELLRHRSTNTTRIYAKVDLTALRKLALTWPGGAR
jgi:site-specific recombinase XerD